MSTVKISDLPEITHLDFNTANTIMVGVELPTDTTAKFTLTTLSEGLYHSNPLKVGESEILLPNTIAQFSGNSETYLQTNLQNFDGDGSADYVATADIGTNSNNYIDMGINGSTFSDSDYSAMGALDGYLYTYGSLDNSSDGNLIIGTASTDANVVFIAGGTTSENVVATISKYGLNLNGTSHIKFSDTSVQTVAAAPANYTQSAFNTANGANGLASGAFAAANVQSDINNAQNTTITAVNNFAAGAFAAANVQAGINSTQNNTILSVNGYAEGAFNKANNALANATGIFDGDLTITEDLTVVDIYNNDLFTDGVIQFTTANGTIRTVSGFENENDINIITGNDLGVVGHGGDINLSPGTGGARDGIINLAGGTVITGNTSIGGVLNLTNSTTPATRAAVEIVGSNGGAQQIPANDGYMLHITGKDDVPNRVILDSFGANSYPLIAGRRGRGDAETPEATQNNDVLMRISSGGWGTTGFAPLGSGRIDFVATENYTDTARGSRIDLFNCADGSNTIVRIASFNSDSVEFTGSLIPEKGFVYTPRLLSGPQTAITVDFSTDAIIKASLDNNLTVSFANYTYGKIVEVWLTNTSGSTRTITHGCSATNSSDNSTTFNIPATSSAYLRYFSLDGDLANTFVTSVHA